MGNRKNEDSELFQERKRPRLDRVNDRDGGICSLRSDTSAQSQFTDVRDVNSGLGLDADSAQSSKGDDNPPSSGVSMEGGASLSGSNTLHELISMKRKRESNVSLAPCSRKKTFEKSCSRFVDERTELTSSIELEEEPPSCNDTAGGVVLTECKQAFLERRTSSFEVDGPLASGALDSPSNEVECHSCRSPIPCYEVIRCSRKDCRNSYHLSCSKALKYGIRNRKVSFTCPQHVCYTCGGHRSERLWRCEKCPIAVHESCCPWPEDMTYFGDKLGWAICWRHSCERRLPFKLSSQVPSRVRIQPPRNVKNAFTWLPLPETIEEFKLSCDIRDEVTKGHEPPPYTHIRRNEFLIKKKRDHTDDGVGCTCGEENRECGDDCECRIQSMSCSKHCVCMKICTNRPYRKDKKLKIVKTEHCGWGAESAEIIRKGEFIIEYIGEVIDDEICEKRLWAMKGKGINKFYMCEIMKDFIIDATYKGNSSRFLNHSCQPNCKLEKWRVDGETRAGVFALRDIALGEPLTYDYKYVEFGVDVKCCCGAPKCRGAIGEKPSSKICWPGTLKWGKTKLRGS